MIKLSKNNGNLSALASFVVYKICHIRNLNSKKNKIRKKEGLPLLDIKSNAADLL